MWGTQVIGKKSDRVNSVHSSHIYVTLFLPGRQRRGVIYSARKTLPAQSALVRYRDVSVGIPPSVSISRWLYVTALASPPRPEKTTMLTSAGLCS